MHVAFFIGPKISNSIKFNLFRQTGIGLCINSINIYLYMHIYIYTTSLCGLVARVPGHRSRGPG
jgi:hypothetical protein